jgi:superfamily II DNA or RNA helicase
MIIPRPYQERDIPKIRESLIKHRKTVYVSPTGSGKGTIAAYIAQSALLLGNDVRFCAHRKHLIAQLEERFISENINGVQFSMAQTLSKQLENTKPPKLLIMDEAHCAVSFTQQKIVEWAEKSFILFLTATPERLSGEGLIEVANDMVVGSSIRELIDLGYLCNYEILTLPNNIELSSNEQYADLVTTYRKNAHNEKCVVMCKDMQHAREVAATYRDAGYAADALYSELLDDKQDAIMRDFTSGKLRVVTSVNMLVEGIDIPDISCIQWARRTDSLIIWLQGNGRGLRPTAGKSRLLILDHMGNVHTHGLPCQERAWTLEGAVKRKQLEAGEPAYNARLCNGCYKQYSTMRRACPFCGTVASVDDKGVKVLQGELKKIETAERKQDLATLKKIHGNDKGTVAWFMQNGSDKAAFAAMLRQNRGKFDAVKLEVFKGYEREIVG